MAVAKAWNILLVHRQFGSLAADYSHNFVVAVYRRVDFGFHRMPAVGLQMNKIGLVESIVNIVAEHTAVRRSVAFAAGCNFVEVNIVAKTARSFVGKCLVGKPVHRVVARFVELFGWSLHILERFAHTIAELVAGRSRFVEWMTSIEVAQNWIVAVAAAVVLGHKVDSVALLVHIGMVAPNSSLAGHSVGFDFEIRYRIERPSLPKAHNCTLEANFSASFRLKPFNFIEMNFSYLIRPGRNPACLQRILCLAGMSCVANGRKTRCMAQAGTAKMCLSSHRRPLSNLSSTSKCLDI